MKAEVKCRRAQVVKLVDTPALGAGPARDRGSSPLLGTTSFYSMQFLINLSAKFSVSLLLLVSALLVVVGDVFAKYWSLNQKTSFFIIGVLGYFLSGVVYIPTLLRKGLVITGMVYSLFSIVGFLIVGLIFFKETLTLLQGIGVMLGVIALILLNL